jgi:hypothetical protein
MINQNMEVTMTKQSVLKTESEQDRNPDSDFCVSPALPVPPFQFFDIQKPHFHIVHGQGMAFAGEVQP